MAVPRLAILTTAVHLLSGGSKISTIDPVGNQADLNLYTYVGNDPTNRTDPTGKYDCSGSQQDCATINNFVGAIDKAATHLDPNSAAGQRVNAAVQYLGTLGDKNGVTIQATSLNGPVSEARQNNTIAIDVGKAKDITSNGLARANPGKSASDVRNAQGGGRVAHEAQNEMGMHKVGEPQSKPAERSLEKGPFQTESDVLRGLGIKSALSSPGGIERASGQAADQWCKSAAQAGVSEPGC
jgi:uncharacterized protein RhaS with RHS repeats